MKILFISRMPLAGAPWETMKCLRKYAGLDVKWACSHDRYPDGRIFPTDILVPFHNQEEFKQTIRESDIIHIQNDHFMKDDRVFQGKKMIFQFHSVPKRGTYDVYKKYNGTYYTVRQPWLEREYPDLPTLPNLLDVEEYIPSADTNDVPVVVFAPSNKWNVSVKGSRAKDLVEKALKEINGINVNSYMGVPYLQNLNFKKTSDILIDDVVNDTFHKTTLEGCCFGLGVITSWQSPGWEYSKLDNLIDTVRKLVENREVLEKSKLKSRNWIVNEWHPKNLIKEYLDAYGKLMVGKLNNTPCYVS